MLLLANWPLIIIVYSLNLYGSYYVKLALIFPANTILCTSVYCNIGRLDCFICFSSLQVKGLTSYIVSVYQDAMVRSTIPPVLASTVLQENKLINRWSWFTHLFRITDIFHELYNINRTRFTIGNTFTGEIGLIHTDNCMKQTIVNLLIGKHHHSSVHWDLFSIRWIQQINQGIWKSSTMMSLASFITSSATSSVNSLKNCSLVIPFTLFLGIKRYIVTNLMCLSQDVKFPQCIETMKLYYL